MHYYVIINLVTLLCVVAISAYFLHKIWKWIDKLGNQVAILFDRLEQSESNGSAIISSLVETTNELTLIVDQLTSLLQDLDKKSRRKAKSAQKKARNVAAK